MELNSNTRLTDILKEYPWLPDELIKIDGRFGIIKTPVGKMMIKHATLADASEKTGLPQETLVAELQKMIDAHEK